MNEDVNRKVWRWAVVQVLVLIGSGLYQVRHLQKFFEAKKLV